jgi:hypothetical protein
MPFTLTQLAPPGEPPMTPFGFRSFSGHSSKWAAPHSPVSAGHSCPSAPRRASRVWIWRCKRRGARLGVATVDDPNNITVVAGFETTEAARAFVDNADLKEAMHRAGVTSQPRIEIFEEVEAIEH